jgi:hypothetical protein
MWNKIPGFRFRIFSRLSTSQPLKIKTHKTEISMAILHKCETGDWASIILQIEDLRNL